MRTLSAASDAIRALAVEVRERAASDQEEIRYWRGRSREIREAHEEAIRVQAQVELERDTELEREGRMTRVTEQASAVLLPVLARKLAPPAPAAPAAASADPAQADQLASVRAAWAHLSPETVDRIAADLPPDLALAVVAAMRGADD
jgi:hypothetical protein